MDNQKILLIEPPFERLYQCVNDAARYPLALGYLAATIKKETDWDVKCYNTNFSSGVETSMTFKEIEKEFNNYLKNLNDLSGRIWKEIYNVLAGYRPDIIGISSKSANFISCCRIAKIAKMIDKKIIVIVGGPHPSTVGRDVFACQDIDIAVIGEGERTIIDVLEAIKNKKGLEGIKGTIFKENGQIYENLPREFISDLDTLGFPHQYVDVVLRNFDKYPQGAFNRIFATRGCPFSCAFCGSKYIWSQKVRFRSPENVIEEIKSLQDKIKGIDFIHFDDDTFGINKQYTENLCALIKKYCRKLRWSCEMHVNLVNEEIISLMKNSGCYTIQLGIESGNNEILKKINKDITIERAIKACHTVKKYGIELQTFFMVGFPWETEDTLNDTKLAMIKSQSDIVQYSIFTPYPGTEMYRFCEDNGLIDDCYDISLYNHHSPRNSFCLYIPSKRFRELAAEIERIVERINSRYSLKHIFGARKIKRIKKLGIRRSFKKGLRIIFSAVTSQ